MQLYERLLAKVKVTASGCFEWQGAKYRRGYGRMRAGKAPDGRHKMQPSHRVAYELFRGEIPEGMVVMHKCDNPCCCNPAHLRIGTQMENVHDAVTKGRIARGGQHYLSKVSDAEVMEIRACVAGGQQKTAIANRFGLNRRTVTDIASGKNYSHLPGPFTQPKCSTKQLQAAS